MLLKLTENLSHSATCSVCLTLTLNNPKQTLSPSSSLTLNLIVFGWGSPLYSTTFLILLSSQQHQLSSNARLFGGTLSNNRPTKPSNNEEESSNAKQLSHSNGLHFRSVYFFCESQSEFEFKQKLKRFETNYLLRTRLNGRLSCFLLNGVDWCSLLERKLQLLLAISYLWY